MAVTKNTADLLAQAVSTLPDNTTQLISPQDSREMAENIAQSSYNKITDSALVGLKEYSVIPTYESGQGCINGGKIYISNKITGPGVFAAADWDVYLDLSTADKAKLDFITVISGVDLNQMASDIAALDGARINKGTFDQSLGFLPGGGTAQDGWTYIAVGVTTTIDGVEINPDDAVVATVDNASTTTFAANWHLQDNTDKVLSVNSQSGNVVLDNTDVGLSNVPNTDFTTAVGLNTAKISFPEAPNDGTQYARKNLGWEAVAGASIYTGNGTVLAGTTATLAGALTFLDGSFNRNSSLNTGQSLIEFTNGSKAQGYIGAVGDTNVNTGSADRIIYNSYSASKGHIFVNSNSAGDVRWSWQGSLDPTVHAKMTSTGLLLGNGIGGASFTERLKVEGDTLIEGTLKIVDTTQGAGKVFTSDASGLGSWQTPTVPVGSGGIYGGNGTVPSAAVATLTDTLRFVGGNVKTETELIQTVPNGAARSVYLSTQLPADHKAEENYLGGWNYEITRFGVVTAKLGASTKSIVVGLDCNGQLDQVSDVGRTLEPTWVGGNDYRVEENYLSGWNYEVFDAGVSSTRLSQRLHSYLATNSSWNLGVGTKTPTAKLHVAGDTQIDGDLTQNGNIAQSDTVINNTITATDAASINDTTFTNNIGTLGFLRFTGSTAAVTGNDLTLSALTLATRAAATRMLFSDRSGGGFLWVNSGNDIDANVNMKLTTTGLIIGGGALSPSEKLHVVGNSFINGNSQINGNITQSDTVINNTATATGTAEISDFTFVNNVGTAGFLRFTGSTAAISNNPVMDGALTLATRSGANKMLFHDNNNGGFWWATSGNAQNVNVDMKLTTTGLIIGDGIGATNPTAKLHVAGSTLLDGNLGVFGTTPIAQGAALTATLTSTTQAGSFTPDYAIQAVTQTTPFGFVTADEAETLISTVINMQTRIDELEARLDSSTGIGIFA